MGINSIETNRRPFSWHPLIWYNTGFTLVYIIDVYDGTKL